jgi:DNA-binding MarR family transcriptional regulator
MIAASRWGSSSDCPALHVRLDEVERAGQVLLVVVRRRQGVLELAAAPDRRLRMTDLSQRVVLSRTRVSRLVDEMSRSGLVTREEHPTDARSAYASLTDAGYARYRQAAPVYLAGIEEHFSGGLTNAELQSVAAALQKVLSR